MKSQTLTFREYTVTDIELLKSIFQDQKVMEFTLDDCYSDENLDTCFAKILNNNISKTRNTFEYAVFDENNYIGFADITINLKNNAGGIAEIGYLISPKYWNQGYGSKIASMLIGKCFNEHKLHRVYAKCNASNIASQKVMQKNNMVLEGTLKAQRFKNGKWVDEYIYGILNKNLPCF